jgi:hypothetical protein
VTLLTRAGREQLNLRRGGQPLAVDDLNAVPHDGLVTGTEPLLRAGGLAAVLRGPTHECPCGAEVTRFGAPNSETSMPRSAVDKFRLPRVWTSPQDFFGAHPVSTITQAVRVAAPFFSQDCPTVMHRMSGVSTQTIHRLVHTTIGQVKEICSRLPVKLLSAAELQQCN